MTKLYTGYHIANGILSLLVLLCGVIMSVLINVLVTKAVEYSMQSMSLEYSSFIYRSGLWSFGMAYMIPGIMGIIAALLRNKCMFITQAVICIISLLIMSLSAIGGIICLGALAAGPSCITSGNICDCGYDDDNLGLLNHNCEQLSSLYGMGVGIIIVLVFGWILMLAATCVCCVLACRPQVLNAGLVLCSVPPSMSVQVQSSSTMGCYAPPMQPPMQPPAYDTARLVENAQY